MDRLSTADATIFLYSIIPEFFEQIYMETGLDFHEYGAMFKENFAEEWMDQKVLKKVTLEILDRERKAPGYLKRLTAASEGKKEIYLEFVERIEAMDLQKLDNEALMSNFGTFLRLYRNQYTLAALPLFYKEHLSEMLHERLAPKLGDRTAEILSYITTPERDSFSFEMRSSMLRIMSDIYDSLGKDLFEKEPEEILGAVRKGKPHIYEQLVEHSKRFFWVNNNYRRVFVLGPLDFVRKMKDEHISFGHPSEELKIMEDTKRDALEKKEEHLAALDDEERMMAMVLSEGSWWQDERKRCNLIADHVMMRFLDEVSRRTGHPREWLVNATSTELGAILYGTADLESIKNRHKEYFSIHCRIKGQYAEVEMKPGRRYEEAEVEHTEEFRGTPASLGKVEGEVVVITTEEDFGKMKDGAILVSVMTRPEYTPLMRRAGGIITDEGGLTCHAAVVSREFKIPCIVGTRHATRILKDGDVVELDASKGLVRLKRP